MIADLRTLDVTIGWMVQIEMNDACYCIPNSYLTYIICIIVVKSLGHKMPMAVLAVGVVDYFVSREI